MQPSNAWHPTTQVVDPYNIYWTVIPQGGHEQMLNYAVVARDKMTGTDLAYSYFAISSTVGVDNPLALKNGIAYEVNKAQQKILKYLSLGGQYKGSSG